LAQFEAVISADSHVMEPIEMWWEQLGGTYGERSPRVIDGYQGRSGKFFWMAGAQVSEVGRTDEEQAEKGLRSAGYDPLIRLDFQDRAGIKAELINPTFALVLVRSPDREIARASCRVYNDWVADFCSADPKRLLGVGIIPPEDVDWATKEFERVVGRGLRSVIIPTLPPEGCKPYRDSAYDPLWALDQELDVPLTLHIVASRAPDPLMFYTPEEIDYGPTAQLQLLNEVSYTMANDFIFGTILDRFPSLKLISSEFEISWLPGFLSRIDQMQGSLSKRMSLPSLEMRASDYVRHRMFHGVIDDPYAAGAIEVLGSQCVVWGSDFPHVRSIGLEAHDTLAKVFGALEPAEQRAVMSGNVAALFGMD
jgi:predicted TIM-barrel fold metal-dependent hydrolase